MNAGREMQIHEDLGRSHKVERSSNRSFGLVFAAVFAVIGLWPLLDGAPARWWAVVVGAAFLVVALVAPAVLDPANRVWHRFGLLLHRIVNPVVTGLLFYVAVTPTAVVMRLAGKDPLRLRFDPKAASYWIERQPPGPAPDTMSNQF